MALTWIFDEREKMYQHDGNFVNCNQRPSEVLIVWGQLNQCSNGDSFDLNDPFCKQRNKNAFESESAFN